MDADGLEGVATFTAELVHALANRKTPLTFIKVPPPPPPITTPDAVDAAVAG